MKVKREVRYTETFKLFIVEEVESGRINKSEASLTYGILGHSTINKWCRKYGKCSQRKGKSLLLSQKDLELLRLTNENKALKQELDDARLKNVVYETLVDVAEKELEIPIRKKYGAKQSVK